MPQSYYQQGDDPILALCPPIYGIIQPTVEWMVDGMITQYGPMFVPTSEHFESMIDGIYNYAEDNMKNLYGERELTRQVWRGRPFLRDLIAVSLIGRFRERRRHFFPHHPEFEHGMHPGY